MKRPYEDNLYILQLFCCLLQHISGASFSKLNLYIE